jgi:hypothetical protein
VDETCGTHGRGEEYVRGKDRRKETVSRPIYRRSRFDPQQRRNDFSFNLCVQTGSVAHPASYTMGTGGSFSGAKARPGRNVDHSTQSSAEVENG